MEIDTLLLNWLFFPCILHWNQNHFIVLTRSRREGPLHCRPGKGLVKHNLWGIQEALGKHTVERWGEGIAMFLEPTPAFYEKQRQTDRPGGTLVQVSFGYIKKYRRYFGQIILGFVGSLLQLILPFLTQSIVRASRTRTSALFGWYSLGQLMLIRSRTAIDFIRRLALLPSPCESTSLCERLLHQVLKLPMSFFDTVDGRPCSVWTTTGASTRFDAAATLSVVFFLYLLVTSCCFSTTGSFLAIFMLGSLFYGAAGSPFPEAQESPDYELFEQQAVNNKTYELSPPCRR